MSRYSDKLFSVVKWGLFGLVCLIIVQIGCDPEYDWIVKLPGMFLLIVAAGKAVDGWGND